MDVKTKLRAIAFFSILAGIGVACLWPFQAPRNNVSWLAGTNGIRFGDPGTLVSRGVIARSNWRNRAGWTLEVSLRPRHVWHLGTIVAFYRPGHRGGFYLRQVNPALVLEKGPWTDEHGPGVPVLIADNVFRGRPLVFLTIVGGRRGTRVYVNGVLTQASKQFRVNPAYLTGQLVVANSPVDYEGWMGDLRGLALYNREFTAEEVTQEFESWNRTGRPLSSSNQGAVALYLFDSHSGRVVHNQAGSGPDLYIPSRFRELHEVFLERPWDEYHSAQSYWSNVALNIEGFIPLGFFAYAYLLMLSRVKRPALLAVLVGCALSFTVEVLQSYVPIRYSGMTDIMTNTSGAAVGVALYRFTCIIWDRVRPHSEAALWRLVDAFVRVPPAEPESVVESKSRA
jgi:hypothetical protein